MKCNRVVLLLFYFYQSNYQNKKRQIVDCRYLQYNFVRKSCSLSATGVRFIKERPAGPTP